MIHSYKNLMDCSIHETDGRLGHLTDILFDDRNEKIRYYVIDIGHWFKSHVVLLLPTSISNIDWEKRKIVTSVSKCDLLNQPALESVMTMGRQCEEYYQDMVTDPIYSNPNIPGLILDSDKLEGFELIKEKTLQGIKKNHLRSAHEILNYHVELDDGETGKVTDYEIDTSLYMISNIIIDCGNWFFHRYKEAPWLKINKISWGKKTLKLNMTKRELEQLPTIKADEYIWQLENPYVYGFGP